MDARCSESRLVTDGTGWAYTNLNIKWKDTMSKKIYDEDLNMLVPWFLMASYAYYRLGVNIMKDSEFDRIANNLKHNWEEVDHMHKHLITLEMLSTSSGYSIKYTNMIKHATLIYIDSLTARQYNKFQKHVKQ